MAQGAGEGLWARGGVALSRSPSPLRHANAKSTHARRPAHASKFTHAHDRRQGRLPPPSPAAQSANDALATEKERMDVLLARQYNLLSCVLQDGNIDAVAARGKSIEHTTLGAAGGAAGGGGGGKPRGITGAHMRARAHTHAHAHTHTHTHTTPPPRPARIEDMRREIGASGGASGVDELQLTELMDEGSYGKVFKGEPLLSLLRYLITLYGWP